MNYERLTLESLEPINRINLNGIPMRLEHTQNLLVNMAARLAKQKSEQAKLTNYTKTQVDETTFLHLKALANMIVQPKNSYSRIYTDHMMLNHQIIKSNPLRLLGWSDENNSCAGFDAGDRVMACLSQINLDGKLLARIADNQKLTNFFEDPNWIDRLIVDARIEEPDMNLMAKRVIGIVFRNQWLPRSLERLQNLYGGILSVATFRRINEYFGRHFFDVLFISEGLLDGSVKSGLFGRETASSANLDDACTDITKHLLINMSSSVALDAMGLLIHSIDNTFFILSYPEKNSQYIEAELHRLCDLKNVIDLDVPIRIGKGANVQEAIDSFSKE